MFRSTLTIIRPVCESCFYNCWLHIGIPLCLQNYASVHYETLQVSGALAAGEEPGTHRTADAAQSQCECFGEQKNGFMVLGFERQTVTPVVYQ